MIEMNAKELKELAEQMDTLQHTTMFVGGYVAVGDEKNYDRSVWIRRDPDDGELLAIVAETSDEAND